VSKRSAAETVSRIFRALVDNRSGSQAELARKVGVSVRALRTRLVELATGGMPLERDEASPLVVWSVPRGMDSRRLAVGARKLEDCGRHMYGDPDAEPTRGGAHGIESVEGGAV
jgi:hypothetical protein